LVAVGRANIELRVLTLPPAPAEELPDMVRFQALKQFSTMGENWPLDYVPLEGVAENNSVLAAAIAPDVVDHIRTVCGQIKVEPKRLVLRPFAAASLWRRRSEDRRCTLMVDMLADEADLTVLTGGQVVFTRTVRLALGGDDELSRSLIGEIRRTIAAAQNQLAGQRVERVVFCGDNEAQAPLRAQVSQNLSLDVEYFDPFSGLEFASGAAARMPEHPGRYAPLLGIVLDAAAGDRPAIDFLDPRRRPAPVSHRRRYLTAAAIGVCVVLVFVFYIWIELAALDARIATLDTQSKGLAAKLKKLSETERDIVPIDEFTKSDVNWLDELYHLSANYPPATDAIVTDVTFMSAGRTGGGQATVDGFARQSNLLDQLLTGLRDERHLVSNTGSNFDDKQDLFKWRFSESIAIAGEDPELRFVPRDRSEPAAESSNAAEESDAGQTTTTEQASPESPPPEKPPERPTAAGASETAGKEASP
jgi:Tfp pilus assembly protein PilN